MTRYYKITTDKGQKLSPQQLNACIFGFMSISTSTIDITEEYETRTTEGKPTEKSEGPVGGPDKQETGKSSSIPNGGAAKANRNTSPADGKPKP